MQTTSSRVSRRANGVSIAVSKLLAHATSFTRPIATIVLTPSPMFLLKTLSPVAVPVERSVDHSGVARTPTSRLFRRQTRPFSFRFLAVGWISEAGGYTTIAGRGEYEMPETGASTTTASQFVRSSSDADGIADFRGSRV